MLEEQFVVIWYHGLAGKWDDNYLCFDQGRCLLGPSNQWWLELLQLFYLPPESLQSKALNFIIFIKKLDLNIANIATYDQLHI